MKFRLITLLLLISTYTIKGQIGLDNSLTIQQLIEDVLVSDGVTISNVTSQGLATAQVAAFTDPNSHYGFTEGIFMTSGRTPRINFPASQDANNVINLNSRDIDLALLLGVSRNLISDAFIIEFDFVPNGDSVSFKYTFASEEYPDYVCSEFNDGFGFFLSGPGINGPYTNNATNIALVPNSTDEVSINSINNGVPGFGGIQGPCNLGNSNYFVTNNGPTIYNGRTVVLEARHPVECGETYHIKLAICDIQDGMFDSGVFLEANSFGSDNYGFSFEGVAVDTLANQAIEGCQLDLTFTRPRNDTTDDVIIPIIWDGTATQNVDYTTNIDSIIFPPGIDTINLSIDVILDNIAEGEEIIEVKLIIPGICSSNSLSFEIPINDPSPLMLGISDTIVIPCGDSIRINPLASGGTNNFDFQWLDDQNTSFGTDKLSDWISANDEGNYSISVIDTCSLDTVFMDFYVQKERLNATANFNILNTVFCVGEDILISNNSQDANEFVWLENGVLVSNNTLPTLLFTDTGSLTISLIAIDNNQCFITDTFEMTITVNDSAFAEFLTEDFCPNDSYTLSSIDTTTGNSYSWSTSDGQTGNLQDFNTSFSGIGNYTATLEVSNSAGCKDDITKPIVVTNTNIVTAAFNLPINRFCNNTVVSPANTSTNASDYVWYSGNGDTSTITNPQFTYTDTGEYSITLIASSNLPCSTIDTMIFGIKIESIKADFIVDTMCQFAPSVFTNLNNTNIVNYSWTINNQPTPSSNANPLNTTFNLPGDYTIGLTITSDIGCTSSTSKLVNVVEQPVSQFTNDEICVGSFTSFTNTSVGGITDYLWNYGDGNSSSFISPDYIYRDSGWYNVALTAFSQYCPDDVFTKLLYATKVPDIDLGDDLNLCVGEEVVLEIPNDVLAQLDYLVWQDTFVSNTFTASTLTPTVIAKAGISTCFKTDELEVFEKCDVYAPSAFTPNGDGTNDFFNALPENVETYTLYVYDRWGQELFTTSDFNFGWDGNQKGSPSPMDIYVYSISGVKIDGNSFQSSGSFVLMR